MKLNPRQEQFCCEYAKSGNATKAYLRAYSNTSEAAAAVQAHRLLKKANVQARLKEIQDALASAKIMNVQEIQERLTAIARGAVSEEIITPKGERTRKQVSIRDMLKAIELLAKCKGMFVAQVDVKATVPVIIGGGDLLTD